jgi:hypothetical protein
MAKWSGLATAAINIKSVEIAERISKAFEEKYSTSMKPVKIGLNSTLLWLGFLNEIDTSRDWIHPKDAIKDIKEIIRNGIGKKSKKLSNYELDAILYPILQEFLNFAFDQAKSCDIEPMSSYKDLYSMILHPDDIKEYKNVIIQYELRHFSMTISTSKSRGVDFSSSRVRLKMHELGTIIGNISFFLFFLFNSKIHYLVILFGDC